MGDDLGLFAPMTRDQMTGELSSRERGLLAYDLIHEFYADFLGILIPGALFSLLFFILFATAGICVFDVLARAEIDPTKLYPAFGTLLNTLPFWLYVIVLVLVGYVVGGTFFRLDPKIPDERSIARILWRTQRSELDRSEVWSDRTEVQSDKTEVQSDQTEVQSDQTRPEESPIKAAPGRLLPSWTEWNGIVDAVYRFRDRRLVPSESSKIIGWRDAERIAKSKGSQFPYLHLKNYLKVRRFDYLAKNVNWDAHKDGGRSKMFINSLKIRLHLVADTKCVTIDKNEAHIRMMSSIWYAARTLYRAGWLSFAIVSVIVSWGHFSNGQAFDANLKMNVLIYSLVLSFTCGVTFWLKRHVELVFHYQRVREVFYVLETAYRVAMCGHKDLMGITLDSRDELGVAKPQA